MAIDAEKWDRPAKAGVVSGIALYTAISLFEIRQALEKIAAATDVDISQHLKPIGDFEREINKIFQDMSGIE